MLFIKKNNFSYKLYCTSGSSTFFISNSAEQFKKIIIDDEKNLWINILNNSSLASELLKLSKNNYSVKINRNNEIFKNIVSNRYKSLPNINTIQFNNDVVAVVTSDNSQNKNSTLLKYRNNKLIDSLTIFNARIQKPLKFNDSTIIFCNYGYSRGNSNIYTINVNSFKEVTSIYESIDAISLVDSKHILHFTGKLFSISPNFEIKFIDSLNQETQSDLILKTFYIESKIEGNEFIFKELVFTKAKNDQFRDLKHVNIYSYIKGVKKLIIEINKNPKKILVDKNEIFIKIGASNLVLKNPANKFNKKIDEPRKDIHFSVKIKPFTFQYQLYEKVSKQYFNKIVTINNRSYLSLSEAGVIHFYKGNSQPLNLNTKFSNFDDFIDDICYDSMSNNVYILSGDKVFYFNFTDEYLNDIKLFKAFYIKKNKKGIEKSNFDILSNKNQIFLFNVYNNVYEYYSDFSPPFKKLKFNLNQLNLSNTSKTEITKISDFNSKGSFNHTQNNFTFHYKTISHYFPETIQYRYKLEGSDYEEWVTTKIDSVNFSNLPPGKYTFVVQAFNGYEVYSDEIRYEFTIHPPFWQTCWFRIGAVLLLFLILYFIYKARTKQLLKRQKQLENTVDERTKEVVTQRDLAQKEHQEAERQRHIVEEKNTEILDSINYAKRLQDAILPPVKLVKEYFEESFILFRPKDIVSGDFYWMETKDNLIMFAAADCTGHGVPGAMVSVVCANALNKSVNELHLTDPAAILNATREIVIETFTKTGSDVKDGMDISLCVLNEGAETLHWAGANNPLWIVRRDQNEIETIKADKQPIGMYGELKPFTSHSIKVNGGDSIYMFSDGYADQFGGERGKKLKSGKFKELLLTNRHEKMEAQKKALNEAFESWKGDLEQIDDVCVIGVRLEEKKDNPFTRREMEIIQHLEQGNSSKMIAEKLFISKTTVDTHRRRILKKAEVGNVTELIKFCKDGGLI